MIQCITLAGPTASGKTDLAIDLAQKLNCPILSADSRQIYKELNIGVAKPSEEELNQVKHYGVNLVSIREEFDTGRYEDYALKTIEEVSQSNDYIILTGGTGLYLESVLWGLDQFPPVKESIKDQLHQDLIQYGLPHLAIELKEKDPDYAHSADLQNSRRVVRALSVIRASGQPYSKFLGQPKKPRNFSPICLQIEIERAVLYQRINHRVDTMMANGLLEEAKGLYPFKTLNALNTVGYKELFQHLSQEISLAMAISEIKKNTRRYAKRQMTWLRNRYKFPLFKTNEVGEILDYIEKYKTQT